MGSSDIARFGAGFLQRVRASLSDDKTDDDVYVCESGLALVRREQGKGLKILGCPDCLGAKMGQNRHGYPTVNGVDAIHAETVMTLPTHFTADVRAKLWLCARCKMPVRNLIPKRTQ